MKNLYLHKRKVVRTPRTNGVEVVFEKVKLSDPVKEQEQDGKSRGCRAILGDPRTHNWKYCQKDISFHEKKHVSKQYCKTHLDLYYCLEETKS